MDVQMGTCKGGEGGPWRKPQTHDGRSRTMKYREYAGLNPNQEQVPHTTCFDFGNPIQSGAVVAIVRISLSHPVGLFLVGRRLAYLKGITTEIRFRSFDI